MIYITKNGRQYLIVDTEKPYQNGEYPTGGYVIKLLHKDMWVYLDNSPDWETLTNFLLAAEKLPPLEE